MAAATASLSGQRFGVATNSPRLLDPDGFASLYEESFDAVFRYALLFCRDQERAEDLAAEAYLKAWNARAGFRGDAEPLSWLFTIVRNCALSSFRARREDTGLEAVQEQVDPCPTPEALVQSASESARLAKAIQHLTVEQQQVIVLRFFEGLPHDEVARRLRRKPAAIRATQFRALARLRQLLEQEA